ncbi:hypothetical protein TSUD_364930 [Trifolium subterraneum]|uniref:PB1-like domain-containing protein n=1 Tax=Trifolium subterraneum TaxID=3900 RepID=A0A2Z6MM68_TRISU|nr:hypothetical protein TSUD_364930 [Trifolium subterraneum]
MGTYVGGDVAEWKCVSEMWGYFDVLKLVKKMKYPEINEMWYDIDGSLKVLVDDKGAVEMEDWAKATGKAQSNVNHEAQFEAQSNVDELDSDEGDLSVVSLDDYDDEHILDGEIFIDEVVHSEPKKKSKKTRVGGLRSGRPKKHIVTDSKGKETVWSNNDIEDSD